ncbi:Pumilio-like mating protein M90 [Phytophthora megakarya]|uniref:Pumilio-like mating protein M90 n=1 Tax=Phytophthora megakarya TaxID=4795 RepID=A0A225X2Z0_9STRA|nr:Pumilio-like mating protein M90 [Phytophthora megakarya]
MGHSDSMSPAKSGSPSSVAPQRAVSQTGSSLAALEKPIHHDNPVEPVRVKLQDPVGYPSDSLWSSEGLKSRSSLLFSASQAVSERPVSFALRAPRLQSKTDARSVHSAQTTPPSESDEGDATVDNQKEDETQPNTSSENAGELSTSWGSTQKLAAKDDQPADNQESESRGLSLNLQLKDDESALGRSNEHPVDIWKNPHNEFENSDFISTVSPTTSPDKQDFPRSSATTSRPIPTRSSRDNGQAVGCRVPPGMSLIDRIQEDFPRTPSPEYGQFENVRRPSFDERDQQTRSMFDISEGMGQLRLSNYRSPYDSGHRSGHDFGDLPRVQQHVADPRLAGVNGVRHTFGRSTSEPPFGGSYHGAMGQGYPSSYAVNQDVQAYPIMMGAGKQRWATNEDAYSFQPSPFDFAPSDFANSHPGHNLAMASYPLGYSGEYRSMKPADKMFKARPSYPLPDHGLYERHDFGGYFPRPQMLHRPKVGRRSDFEYFPVAHSYSSNSLLEEFNSAPKSEKWGLSAIKGHLFIFAKDQTGSRFIQQKLEKADERLKADAFNEIFPNSLLLMTDVFGNYVIQKFLEYGSLEQQQLLVELMTSNMISLALQVYGCRVIQRALEVTQVEEQLALIRQLKGHVMKCVVDQNGNHVLQKCIEAASWKRAAEYNGLGPRRFVTGEDIQFIIDSFVGSAAALSTHSYGCRVIQRVLEHCAPNQIRPLLDEIIFKCRDLVKDQFGNYVVQHVISHGEQDQRNIVMQAVLPEIARWSQHKYASNVVESCLEHATKEEISQIIDFILQCDESGVSCALLPMMKHMYGNYVVQKLLDRADDNDRHRIVCIIRHNEDYLKRFTFGKHVLSRLVPKEQANNYY